MLILIIYDFLDRKWKAWRAYQNVMAELRLYNHYELSDLSINPLDIPAIAAEAAKVAEAEARDAARLRWQRILAHQWHLEG